MTTQQGSKALVLDVLVQAFGSLRSLEWTDELSERWFLDVADMLVPNRNYSTADLPARLGELSSEVSVGKPPWVGLLRHGVATAADKADADLTTRLDMRRRLRGLLPYDLIEFASGRTRKELLADLASTSWPSFDGGVADAHVHSGGATPMVTALEWLIRNAVTTQSKRAALVTDWSAAPFEPTLIGKAGAGGGSLHIYPLMAGVSWVAGVLAEGVDSWRENARKYGGAPGGWAENCRFWAETARLAGLKDELRYTDLAALWDGVRVLADAELVPNFTLLSRELERVVSGSRTALDRETTVLLRGTVTAISILHITMTSPLRSNLDNFADRFALLSRFRKVHDLWEDDDTSTTTTRMTNGARRIVSAVRYLSTDTALSRLELRKTLKPPVSTHGTSGVGEAKAELLQDLRDHLFAVRHYLKQDGGGLALQMPVSFLRSATTPQGDSLLDDEGLARHVSRRKHRFPLPSVLAVAQAIGEVLRDKPKLWPFIGGVDVAGRENDCANWVFGAGYHLLQQLLVRPTGCEPFVYSIHAGEYFGSQLQGLRRIGEVLMFQTPVTRIGHCLALDPSRKMTGGQRYPYCAAELLDDLCWAHHFAASTNTTLPTNITRGLAKWLRKLAGVVFGVDVDPLVLSDWYARRFSPRDLARIGVKSLFPSDKSAQDSSAVSWVEWDVPKGFADLTDVLLAAFVFHGRFQLLDVTAPPIGYDPDIRFTTGAEELRSLATMLYDQLRPLVVDHISQNKSIFIECCPSSNIAIGDYGSFREHPLSRFLEDQLRCTVNTDDPGLFAASIEEEFVALAATGIYSKAQLQKILDDGIALTAIGMPADCARNEYDALCGEIAGGDDV